MQFYTYIWVPLYLEKSLARCLVVARVQMIKLVTYKDRYILILQMEPNSIHVVYYCCPHNAIDMNAIAIYVLASGM